MHPQAAGCLRERDLARLHPVEAVALDVCAEQSRGGG